jgi:predicted RNase H-like nuclease (RuvC/YqgF family)
MNNQFEADKAAVQAIEYQMLEKLRKLRQEVAEASSSSGAASSKEFKALQEENEMLKKKVAKQAYRIEHLIQGIMNMQK